MRWLPLIACLGCGGTSPIAGAPAVATPAPDAPAPEAATLGPRVPAQDPALTPVVAPTAVSPGAPPLARLTRPGAVFMLVIDDGQPRCERWGIEPGEGATARLVAIRATPAGTETEWISLESEGAVLRMTGAERIDGEVRSGFTCSHVAEAHEVADGFVVDGARWFDDAAGCRRAIAGRQRVATALACRHPATVPAPIEAAARKKFAAMLTRGGVAFAIANERCEAVHAKPDRKRRTRVAGELWTALREARRRGRLSYHYELLDDQLVLLGPSMSWSDGSSMGYGCGDRLDLAYGRDSVELAQTHYLSLASCRAALAHGRAVLAWAPGSAGDPEPEELAAVTTPSIGGC